VGCGAERSPDPRGGQGSGRHEAADAGAEGAAVERELATRGVGRWRVRNEDAFPLAQRSAPEEISMPRNQMQLGLNNRDRRWRCGLVKSPNVSK